MTSKPTKPRNCLSRGGGNPRTNPARQHVNREIGDNLPKANVVRGLVPRWGRVGAWQNPPCQFAEPTHNSNFSYLGVQAQAGMSDWYENEGSRHPLSSFRSPTIFFPATHNRHSRHPLPLSRHPLSSLRSPLILFPATHYRHSGPPLRLSSLPLRLSGEGRNPGGEAREVATETRPNL